MAQQPEMKQPVPSPINNNGGQTGNNAAQKPGTPVSTQGGNQAGGNQANKQNAQIANLKTVAGTLGAVKSAAQTGKNNTSLASTLKPVTVKKASAPVAKKPAQKATSANNGAKKASVAKKPVQKATSANTGVKKASVAKKPVQKATSANNGVKKVATPSAKKPVMQKATSANNGMKKASATKPAQKTTASSGKNANSNKAGGNNGFNFGNGFGGQKFGGQSASEAVNGLRNMFEQVNGNMKEFADTVREARNNCVNSVKEVQLCTANAAQSLSKMYFDAMKAIGACKDAAQAVNVQMNYCKELNKACGDNFRAISASSYRAMQEACKPAAMMFSSVGSGSQARSGGNKR